MERITLTDDWGVRPRTSLFDEVSGGARPLTPVRLPHDAMLSLARSADASGGTETGFFPGGAVEYIRLLDVPESYREKRLSLEFEGVYRDAQVYVNGQFVGHRPNGYARFIVDITAAVTFGEPNKIRVEARTHKDSRWYSGLGIHRPVHLLVSDPVDVVADGVRITTPDVDQARAVIAVATTVANTTAHTVTVFVTSAVDDPAAAEVAVDEIPVSIRPGERAVVRQRLYVDDPQLWSVDTPSRYRVRTSLRSHERAAEPLVTDFGIRTLQLDPRRGLRINGVMVKLRGACVHHDNGILGAAALGAAEERRVRILKDSGFNAIRASHNPLSRAMLDACDRLGVLVIDEAFDVWTQTKMAFDYSNAFPEWWERDLEAMIGTDFNHPSVIGYSIGNEIPEIAGSLGSALEREIAEAARRLDPTRFLTSAVNGLLTVMEDLAPSGEAGVNSLMGDMGAMLDQLVASDVVGDRIREPHSIVDIAGMNYGEARYAVDRERNPNRIIVGSETYGPRIDQLWRLVQENDNVIGDFTWTGWDYLGEVGIGRVAHAEAGGRSPHGLMAGFPSVLAGSGDIDISGHRRPMSYYRETVFGLRSAPYIAVLRPQHHGKTAIHGPWSWSDSVSSWAWDAPIGAPISIEVYSDAEEIELALDSIPLGRVEVGAEKAFLARFETAYALGTLTATAFVAGEAVGRHSLCSASSGVMLAAELDAPRVILSADSIAYLAISLVDDHGTVLVDREAEVSVRVDGPGHLLGLGSARMENDQSFIRSTHRTYDGRLLAAIRPDGDGNVTIIVESEGLDPVSIQLDVTRR